MAKEIEVEIEIDNLEEIKALLKERGLVLIERFRMKDIYFDKAEFYRNRRIRLRKKDIFYPQKTSCGIYTEKSPSMKDGIQIADEKEQLVDFNEAYNRLIKKGISYESTLNVERYSFKNSTIELRQSIGVMNYIEIESPSTEELEEVQNILSINGRILKEGALNRSLEIKGMKKIRLHT